MTLSATIQLSHFGHMVQFLVANLMCAFLSSFSFSVGQYTAWLIMPSIVGLLVFLYGYMTLDSPENTA